MVWSSSPISQFHSVVCREWLIKMKKQKQHTFQTKCKCKSSDFKFFFFTLFIFAFGNKLYCVQDVMGFVRIKTNDTLTDHLLYVFCFFCFFSFPFFSFFFRYLNVILFFMCITTVIIGQSYLMFLLRYALGMFTESV